jgi:hypothetical protein
MKKELTKKQLKRRLKLVEVCIGGLVEELIESNILVEGKHYHKGVVTDRVFGYNGEDYSYDDSVDILAHYLHSFYIIADLDSEYADIEMKLDEEINK